jgi:hypothetical protein
MVFPSQSQSGILGGFDREAKDMDATGVLVLTSSLSSAFVL